MQIPAEMVHYGMTKTAQIAVARGIAESVAGTVDSQQHSCWPDGVRRCNGVRRGHGKAPEKSKEEVEREFFEHVRPPSLLKRLASIDEVAALATYVASELSSATNGAALRVDGGVVRAIL